jgi:hypothetical protein
MAATKTPTTTPATSSTLYANYSNYVSQVLLADKTGSVPAIPNALATAELDTAILTDPVTIQAYKSTFADQLNAQSAGPKFTDLSDRITEPTLTTVVQGAGTIELPIIDPYWLLLTSGFISVDQNGYLDPIDVNFPTKTDCVWRLCQVKASVDFTQPNLILTFEDRIVSLLRLLSPGNGGIQQGEANQTLGGFIKELVDSANTILKPVPPIRLVELIDPQDPNYTVPITATGAPTSLRNNPIKAKNGLQAQMVQLLNSLDQHQLGAFPTGTTTSFKDAEPAYARGVASLSSLNSAAAATFGTSP